jgi:energy-coupling factor transporter ATP-binding protein EcfA2
VGIDAMLGLDARSFRIISPDGVTFTFEEVLLNQGESGILICSDNSAREVFFNSVFGWTDQRHRGWKTEGAIVTSELFNTDMPRATLISRNPEPQLSACFEATILELVTPLALNGVPADTQRVVAEFLLSAFGLSTAANWPAETLSTGQKQRLILASCLSICDSLLLVDSPMEFIDPIMRRRLLSFVTQFCKARNISCLFAASDEQAERLHTFDRRFKIDSSVNPSPIDFSTTNVGAAALDDPVESCKHVLVVETLEYIVPHSQVRLYAGMTFAASAGTGIVLCGPNGSGKSTLAHIVAGSLAPSSGRVLVHDKPASAWFERADPQLALAFPDPDLTITQKSVRAELDAIVPGRITEPVYRNILLLLRLATQLDVNPFDLNWHQRRRLTLAKAIKAARTILFVDEPAADADAEERRSLALILDMCVRAGLLVIVATNDDKLAEAIGFARTIQLAPAQSEPLRTDNFEERTTHNLSTSRVTPWSRVVDEWLQGTAEFSFFWDKYVYPKLLPLLAEIKTDRKCVLVDLGCGHGLHTTIVSRILKANGITVSSIIGVDDESRFIRSADALFGAEDAQFIKLNLINNRAIEELGEKLRSVNADIIFTAFFSLHDIASLDGIKLLLEQTKDVGGTFIAVVLSPDWVRNSGVVRDQQFAKDDLKKNQTEGKLPDWEWVGSFPVLTAIDHTLRVPYYFRELSDYEKLLLNAWPTVRKITTGHDLIGSTIPKEDESGLSKQDEIVILSTTHRTR